MGKGSKKEHPQSWRLNIERSLKTPTGDTTLYYKLNLHFVPFIGLTLYPGNVELKNLIWDQETKEFWSYDELVTERPLEEIIEKHRRDGWQEPIVIDERTGEVGLP